MRSKHVGELSMIFKYGGNSRKFINRTGMWRCHNYLKILFLCRQIYLDLAETFS
jgi:hypothetical protein